MKIVQPIWVIGAIALCVFGAVLMRGGDSTAQVSIDTDKVKMVAFFPIDRQQCPKNWEPLREAEGRVLRGTNNADKIGSTNGSATLTRAKIPEHDHHLSFDLKVNRYQHEMELDGENAGNRFTNGTFIRFDGRVNGTKDETPYIFYLACQETQNIADVVPEKQRVHNNLPSQSISYFYSNSCPTGWSLLETVNAAERTLLPLPSSLENGAVNTVSQFGHKHDYLIKESTTMIETRDLKYFGVAWSDRQNRSAIPWADEDGVARDDDSLTHQTGSHEPPSLYLTVCQNKKPDSPEPAKKLRPNAKHLPNGIGFFSQQSQCPQKPGGSIGQFVRTNTNGRFILGAPLDMRTVDAGQQTFFQRHGAGSTLGGEASISAENRDPSHTHKLSIDSNLASHTAARGGLSSLRAMKEKGHRVSGETVRHKSPESMTDMHHYVMPYQAYAFCYFDQLKPGRR